MYCPSTNDACLGPARVATDTAACPEQRRMVRPAMASQTPPIMNLTMQGGRDLGLATPGS